jgi:hypothetical protein
VDIAFAGLIGYLLFGKNAVATVTTAQADVSKVEQAVEADVTVAEKAL